MSEIYQLLDQLEPVEQDQQQMRPLTALFHYPLALALIMAFLYLLYLNMPRGLTKEFSTNSNEKQTVRGDHG